MQDKFDITREFIKEVKNHDVLNDGPININDIENKTNYSIRHFNRIFSEYSEFTPFEYAERFRLLQCVEYIQKGKTLKTAAIQFGYTPEGLSKAIKLNLGLSVDKIRKDNFILKKDIKINSMWKRLDSYKLQYSTDIFCSFMDSLEREKTLKHILAEDINNTNSNLNSFDLVLDYKEIEKIIKEIDESSIEKNTYEGFAMSDTALMYILLNKSRNTGISELTVCEDEIYKYYFVFGFFFETESPELINGYYTFRLDEDIRAIFMSLNEIEEVTNQVFDMKLHATIKDDKVTLELGAVYKEALLIWKSEKEIV